MVLFYMKKDHVQEIDTSSVLLRYILNFVFIEFKRTPINKFCYEVKDLDTPDRMIDGKV